MYSNIGKKIKGLAQIIAWIGIIGSILGGIFLMVSMGNASGIVSGIILAALGALLSWIGGFLFYGFGQLVDNTDRLVELETLHHI